MDKNDNTQIAELKAKLEIYEKWHNSDAHHGGQTNRNSGFSQESLSYQDDEIDLKELFLVLWTQKLKIFAITALFAIASIIYALSLPNIYSSTVKLVPTNQESQSGLSSLASKYGGLASMAGINLGGGNESNRIQHAVELMKSWPYIDAFIDKHNLKPTLMATKGWNKTTNHLVYDEDVYDIAANQWLSDKNETLEPSSYHTYQITMKEFLSINYDDGLGILSITANHYSPLVAYELTSLLTKEVNEFFRSQDKEEAKMSIQFIQNKIASTSNTQMLEVFYNMIESHEQTIMLTEVNEEYLVKTLIPAKVADPKFKTKPKRALVVALSTLLGGMLSVLYVLVRYFMRKY